MERPPQGVYYDQIGQDLRQHSRDIYLRRGMGLVQSTAVEDPEGPMHARSAKPSAVAITPEIVSGDLQIRMCVFETQAPRTSVWDEGIKEQKASLLIMKCLSPL